jgi:hypothetical protein
MKNGETPSMKNLLLNNKSRWFTVVTAILLFTLGGSLLTKALARPRSLAREVLAIPSRAAAYTAGNFSFTAPLELTGHPPSPAFFQQDGEPEIAADLFGTIYVTAIQGVPGGTDLWKSTDRGASFTYLGQPDGAQDHCNPPVVQCVAAGGGDDQIDVSTGGYLYVSALWLGNVTMSTSYDGGIGGAVPGQKWEVDPAAAEVVGDDRQWVAAYGPQTVGMTYAANTGVAPEIGLFFVKSTDGGKTFGPAVAVSPVGQTDSINVEGNLVVDPYSGNFYTCFIPAASPNVVDLASSTDGGMTWNATTAYTGPAGSTARGVFPIMALDRGGNLHLVFTRTDSSGSSHVFLTSTADPADPVPSWVPAIQVDNGGATNTACEAWVVAGSPGTVDVAWLGSTAASAAVVSNWNVFFAQVTNSMSANPTIAQNQVETASVHDGSICFNGGGCNGTPHGEPNNRDMLEYFRITLAPDGNVNIAYADSINNCDPNTCVTNAWYAKQTAGSSAYNPPAAPQSATFATNLSMPNSTGTAEPNSWTDTHNCIYGGSIGGPIDFISKDTGLSFTEHAVVLGTGLHGGDFDIKTLANANGARPDQIYTADLGVTTVHIGKSTDGGNTYFQPGMMGAAGEVSVSSDRMWLYGDRGVPTATDQTIYLMDHEFTTEAIRFAALTNDVAWSPFAVGTTSPELVLPPTSTLPNTNPGPTFVDKNSHTVYGLFGASTTTTNTQAPPFGKEPNLWEAAGAAPTMAGLPPGPFTDFPVFKGMIDSPTQAPSPAPSIPPSAATIGSHVANIFPSGAVDSSGNVYAVWSTNSTRYNTTQANNSPSTTFDIWFAASHDGGQNFYGPWKVSSGTGTSVFPWIAAGDAGRVSICWYQTGAVAPPLVADPSNPGALSGGPNNMPPTAAWTVMFSQSLNANSREPVFSTASQASDHVIHTGSISNGGTFGSSDRSLLDFFSVSVGPDGLSNIFCADNDSSGPGTTHINYMRQNSGPLAVSNPSAVTCVPLPVLTSVVSEKTHGGAGTFDINLPLPPNSSPRGVECRGTGSTNNYTLVFTFTNSLTSVAGATVTAHNPSNGTGTVSGTFLGPGLNQCTVNLTGVSTGQYITVMLNNVTDMTGASGNIVSPQMGVLVGDVDATGRVDGNDVSAVQSHTRQTANAMNFRDDVDASGRIDGNDVSTTQAQTRTGLPSSP